MRLGLVSSSSCLRYVLLKLYRYSAFYSGTLVNKNKSNNKRTREEAFEASTQRGPSGFEYAPGWGTLKTPLPTAARARRPRRPSNHSQPGGECGGGSRYRRAFWATDFEGWYDTKKRAHIKRRIYTRRVYVRAKYARRMGYTRRNATASTAATASARWRWRLP